MQLISMERLRQDPPPAYLLDADDVLGIYIENVLGTPDEPPPVHFDDNGDKPPAIGFPIPVREDGTIALPLVPPIKVAGMTMPQATEVIRKAYTIDRQLLPEGKDRIIVTLIRKRVYRVLVVREEANVALSANGQLGPSKRGTGYTVDLDAYENDLLHALNETGGLPGLDAKNEILIYRGGFKGAVERDMLVAQINASKDPCGADCPIPPDPHVVTIPIRFHPECMPTFTEEDIILETGDIVMIQSRDREKFYTAGVLGGGEHLLPRDYDLNVLQAIAVAGGAVGTGGALPGNGTGGGGGGRGGQSGGIAPSKAIIFRSLPGNRQVAIRVDLNRALEDPGQRLLIQPEDVILVRYTFAEEIWNTALSVVRFNFLFNGFNGGGVN